MANKVLTKCLVLILLSNFIISHVEAGVDVGDVVGDVFSWMKVQWKKTKKEVKGVLNKITLRSSKNKEDTSPLPVASSSAVITNPATYKVKVTTTTANNRLQVRKSDICGISKYSAFSDNARVRRDSDGAIKPPISMRISGGFAARKNELPWQVRLLIDKDRLCGGTVLNSRTILTAAHCIVDKDVSKYQVYLADHSLTEVEDGERKVQIVGIIRHPRFDPNDPWSNDFALLITSKEIPMSKNDDEIFIRPICMPIEGTFLGELAGLKVTISGWGHFDSREKYFSRILKIADVMVMNHYVCKSRYKDIKTITQEMLCASYQGADAFVDSCQGDSGGSMITSFKGRQTLIGVTSFGVNCNNKDKIPGVYGRITTALGWIQANAVGPLHYAD